ncbi:hypothetical protein [Alkalihalophilus marmarensis]|uniref:Uncharacterized protein n=1 Tax=Alkalihalophilus marmarensis DSM 21297 TaxID=1188261 RepID=U6SSI3_9BACI|nr:hypothetical protein [Alkalihalophilus marmarensis]ERN54317.1 hypothetical protein A33I_07785 [Alkalihalophilus marmarensis DSM 21297]
MSKDNELDNNMSEVKHMINNENSEAATEENVVVLRASIKKIWSKMKETISKFVERAYEIIKNIVIYYSKNPPVGYKRLIKKAELDYYNSIAEGRSNNWRRARGLPLIREV